MGLSLLGSLALFGGEVVPGFLKAGPGSVKPTTWLTGPRAPVLLTLHPLPAQAGPAPSSMLAAARAAVGARVLRLRGTYFARDDCLSGAPDHRPHQDGRPGAGPGKAADGRGRRHPLRLVPGTDDARGIPRLVRLSLLAALPRTGAPGGPPASSAGRRPRHPGRPPMARKLPAATALGVSATYVATVIGFNLLGYGGLLVVLLFAPSLPSTPPGASTAPPVPTRPGPTTLVPSLPPTAGKSSDSVDAALIKSERLQIGFEEREVAWSPDDLVHRQELARHRADLAVMFATSSPIRSFATRPRPSRWPRPPSRSTRGTPGSTGRSASLATGTAIRN